MSIFGTIKAVAGRGVSRVEEQIEKEKRKAAEQSDTKTRERRRYDELLARGIQPSVALKTIERERGTAMTVVPPVQRYQKVYPGRKETRIQRALSPPEPPAKTGFMGVDWGKAASKVSSNIQTNVAKGTALGGIKQPDFGADIGFFMGAKPKQKKGHVVGYDMWNQPIYGEAPKKKHKGKGKGRDIIIHVRR